LVHGAGAGEADNACTAVAMDRDGGPVATNERPAFGGQNACYIRGTKSSMNALNESLPALPLFLKRPQAMKLAVAQVKRSKVSHVNQKLNRRGPVLRTIRFAQPNFDQPGNALLNQNRDDDGRVIGGVC